MNEALQSFLDAANKYIAILDRTSDSDLVETCSEVHQALLGLQQAALALPETVPNTDDPVIVTEAKRIDRAMIEKRFYFRYRMADQVLVITNQPCEVRQVSEDLCEIYDALQDILALNAEKYFDDALWEARGGYVEDWGYYIVSVQAALWKFIAEAKIEAEEAAEPTEGPMEPLRFAFP